ncbi:DNA internalization-related competence protein ComEC/Rec2 [Lachnospiraceae bacterium MD1]|uniref:DNA internalization-related competence protein ComEC/Rec2 n=1 Tax=Variimorphobacter saccharofermentans TaxID=2755051 RepID=A0A839K144_9FIRM|nr:DNA internalization-related competence protein ComEC/Rec2 [Variimorphobacter saccharofermentans]MBB2182649.1 DNA internalization-related competence protein ComEC/Rec2 [Variimorphobacter saccharofermentans]
MIKRPLIWLSFAYIIGICFTWSKMEISWAYILIAVYLFLISYLFRQNHKRIFNRQDRYIWFLPLLFLMGVFSTLEQIKPPEIDRFFEREIRCELTGDITTIVEREKGKTLYVTRNTITLSDGKSFLCENIIIYTSNSLTYRVGNQIIAKGKLQKFSKATNPGQFNELLYFQIENIDYKMISDEIMISDAGYSRYHALLGEIKTKFMKVYQKILPQRNSGVIIAMLLGEKHLLEEDIESLYRENGLSHILAISGLHTSLIGMSIFWILKRCRIPVIPATLVTILFLYSYGILTNFSISTNRAVVMMIIQLLAAIFGKTYDMLSAMALSALIILLQNPLQLFSAGFLLSFGAVLGISVILPCFRKLISPKNQIIDKLLLSICAQIATTPMILLFYYQYPLYGVLTNLVLLPLMTLLTLTAILAGVIGVFFLPAGVFLAGGVEYILRFYEGVCKLGSSLPYNLVTVGKPNLLQITLYILHIILFAYIANRKQCKIILLIPLFATFILLLPQQNPGLQITMLDVGQGEAIYMKTDQGTTFLVDGGSSDVKKVGSYRIEPFLLSQGSDTLHYVIVTHSDYDHISGLTELILNHRITIHHLILPYLKTKDEAYMDLESLAIDNGISVHYIQAGNTLTEGRLNMTCLHPSADFIGTSSNSFSTVLSVNYGEFDLLLTGDMDMGGEDELISMMDYDILQVAHHGSKYSTSKEFLNVVKPEYSLISCGKNNRYGHPHMELLNRLDDVGSEVTITYESGAITIMTDGERVLVRKYTD